MVEREDQGKALLRMLHEGQPASATPLGGHQSTSFSDVPPARTSSQSQHDLPFVDVRSAAAGEHDADDSPTTPIQSIPPFLLPRPGASANTPAYSAGADLLRMLQHGTPPAAQTSTINQQQSDEYQHQHHPQQQQPQRDTTPPPSTSRKVAAEQERFLKNFLAIGDSTGSSVSPSTPPPPSMPPPAAVPPAAAAAQTFPSSSLTATDAGEGRAKNQKARGKDRGRGRGQRGGRARGGDGNRSHHSPARASVGGAGRGQHHHHTENAPRGRGRGQQGRGEQGRGGTGRDAGRDSSKKGTRGGGRNGGGGGGGGGGRGTPAASPKYAWSAFQNSPDPKSIPIPSLQHFSLTPGVSSGEDGAAASAESSNWREGSLGSRGVGGATAGQAGGMQTPSSIRAKSEGRSSAKQAEDDIKRMLGLN